MIRQFRYSARPSRDSLSLIDQHLARAHRYYNTLVTVHRQLFVELKAASSPEGKGTVREAHNARVREARSRSGLYWGTYQAVEERIRVAAGKSRGDIQYRRWEGTGSLAVHFQPAVGSSDLLMRGPVQFGDVIARRAKDSESDVTRGVRMRIGQDPEDSAEIEVRIDRPLPEGRVSWVRLKCEREATHRKWFLVFTVDDGRDQVLPPAEGLLAIDIGWRKLGGGPLRVAAWIDAAGNVGELRLPVELLAQWWRIQEMESERANHLNEAIGYLRALREGWPAESTVRDETAHSHAWKQQRLAGFITRWRGQLDLPFADPGPGFGSTWPTIGESGYFERWRQRDKKLYEAATGMRRRCLGQRRAIYADFAAWAARYRTVAIEALDLRKFAEHRDEKDAPAIEASRGRRHFAALSELLDGIAAAGDRTGMFLAELSAKDSTRDCHWCGARNEIGAELMVVCAGCRKQWDVDDNARRNLLRAVQLSQEPLTRSKRQRTEKAGKSTIRRVREEAAARRKAEALESESASL